MVKTHLSVELAAEDLLKLNLWCQIEGMTQSKAVTRLIKESVPTYRIEQELG